ncbi:acetamidase/formamidase family protein [Nisaea acidiphila]|uniref:Acetamidase/formamidase family protein n=1 Tax=Nisaea acidiphila TaxID=1862145 RepID=A0A9J7ANW4_9PROT|nr:acetamidase/formamidase family protein [Nisaea acidiphila]UUX48610.1 acetamidase/formamidase family protein [Nisaea acidiphila]
MSGYRLESSPNTVHWGFFDAGLEPVLKVASGDEVTIATISGDKPALPGPGYTVLPEHREVIETMRPGLPGHILTGPVHVEGAKPGHVLQVDILDVKPRQDWGFNYSAPLKGALPDDFDEVTHTIIAIDAERNVGRLPWGLELPLAPFFGVMGVAPPPAWGRVSTIQPRANGGNLDNKELVAGTTLFLPVFVEGALFSAGDGHGAQGDGEVCVTAIEMALEGRFRLTVREDMSLPLPRAETADHFITMAFNEDLDEAGREALRQMLDLITERTNRSRPEAYMLCSLAADLRVTQMVNGNKGIHVMLAKHLLDAG